jgi:predicted permease
MELLFRDLRSAWNALKRNPGFASTAVLTLALGVGANTAIFSLIDAYFLRPLPGISNPNQLVMLQPTKGENEIGFSYPAFEYYQQHARLFSGLAAYRYGDLQLGGAGDPRRVPGAAVSSSYFSVLGVRIIHGRDFLPEENRTPGAYPVAIISDRLWTEYLAADPAWLGRNLLINGRAFTIVGIAPRDFQGMEPGSSVDVWAPLAMYGQAMPDAFASLDAWNFRWLDVIGRLAPGATLPQARTETAYIAGQLQLAEPQEMAGEQVKLAPRFGLDLDRFQAVLLAAAGFLLLIACANVANLFLARGWTRRKELAIRRALGASRARIVSRFVSEGALISLFGAMAAVPIGVWAAGLMLPLLEIDNHPLALNLMPDLRVLGFTLAVSVLGCLAFAVAPALKISSQEPGPLLGDGPVRPGLARFNTRNLLVISQVSVSLVLLVGAELLLKTLRRMDTLKPGFDSSGVLLAEIQPGIQGYDRARLDSFYRQVQERVQKLPGVEAASLGSEVLVGGFWRQQIARQGREPARAEDWTEARFDVIAPDYFRTMRVPVLEGREFDGRDNQTAPRAVILNERMSRLLFEGEDPVGKLVHLKGEQSPREVVGIVGDVWHPALWESAPAAIYYPLFQDHPGWNWAVILHIRTAQNPALLASAVRKEVQEMDNSLPVYDVQTLDRYIHNALWMPRTVGAVIGVAGILGLLMAALGLYGVMSYGVAQRTHEIGIRMAIGADRSGVMRMIVGQGLVVTVIGVVAGSAGAVVLTRTLSGFLYGLNANDPASFIAAAIALLVVSLAACYIPARRAMKIDPMAALRHS